MFADSEASAAAAAGGAVAKGPKVHPDFRLWLTSLPTPAFPVSVLQNGLKLTNEAPKGLKANLTRSYNSLSDQATALQPPAGKEQELSKLTYALCFFHAIIIERKKYGSLGWNIQYAFTEGDLSVVLAQLCTLLVSAGESGAVPFDVLRFLTAEIHYGGRVTDEMDRRTMSTLLESLIVPRVLEDDFAFSPSGLYMSLPVGDHAAYLSAISQMSLTTQPEVFGMHENADMVCAQEETSVMMRTILGLLPRTTSSASRSREELIGDAATSILARLPPVFDLHAIGKKYPTLYEESMNTVLLQETIRYNALLSVLHSSLRAIGKCLKGELVMTDELEKLATSLFDNTLPELWTRLSYPSLMPLQAYISDLLARVTFLQSWVGQRHSTRGMVQWILLPAGFPHRHTAELRAQTQEVHRHAHLQVPSDAQP